MNAGNVGGKFNLSFLSSKDECDLFVFADFVLKFLTFFQKFDFKLILTMSGEFIILRSSGLIFSFPGVKKI